jgi:hypothetical protein
MIFIKISIFVNIFESDKYGERKAEGEVFYKEILNICFVLYKEIM